MDTAGLDQYIDGYNASTLESVPEGWYLLVCLVVDLLNNIMSIKILRYSPLLPIPPLILPGIISKQTSQEEHTEY